MNERLILSAAIPALALSPTVHAHSAADVASAIALLTHLLISPEHVGVLGLIVLFGLGALQYRIRVKSRHALRANSRAQARPYTDRRVR